MSVMVGTQPRAAATPANASTEVPTTSVSISQLRSSHATLCSCLEGRVAVEEEEEEEEEDEEERRCPFPSSWLPDSASAMRMPAVVLVRWYVVKLGEAAGELPRCELEFWITSEALETQETPLHFNF
jgi:hypothetical protein